MIGSIMGGEKENRISFRTGHDIRGYPMPLSLSPATVDEKTLNLMDYEISFRGLLIKMSGNFYGSTVLLIDPGKSRWLYDWYITHGRKDEFMRQVISGLNRDFFLWLGGNNPKFVKNNPKLVICGYDYNIETVMPLKQE